MWGPIAGVVIVATMASSCASATASTNVPSDAEIRQILTERVDVQHKSVGIVAGVISAKGRRVVAYGNLDEGDTRPLNGDTVFEIGSITKVFTSLLLADMARDGQVSLDDPVTKYLPVNVNMPENNDKAITLTDLATHTSGLPRLPSNMSPKDPNNPYADYSVEQLYQFLSNYPLTRDPGSQFEYSNLGAGLLGHALARRADTDYEALVLSRICGPLGMKDTRITFTPEMKTRLAVGHDAELKPVENWDMPTLAGAGALRSTANDLLTFLAANLGVTKSPLAPAMAAQLGVRRPTGQSGEEASLGWAISTRDGKEIIWHNGGPGGSRSWMGYDAKARIGVVVLSNAETPEGVDDIGRHLLDPGSPLIEPTSEHTQVAVDTALFDAYVGDYQLTPSIRITIRRVGDSLFAKATGQGMIQIFPESDRDYFAKDVDLQITFVAGSGGRASELILHQGGRDTRAKRVE